MRFVFQRLQAFPGEFFYIRAFAPPSGIPAVIPAIFLFDKNENGKYRYGNTSLVLQVGIESDQKLQGTVDNPLKGGVAVVNSRGGG